MGVVSDQEVLMSPVPAYVDPMSGGMILQLICAGLAGIALVIKLFWRRIVRFFRACLGRPTPSAAEQKPVRATPAEQDPTHPKDTAR